MAKGFTSTLTSQEKTIGLSNPTDLLNVSFLNHFEVLTDPRIERSKEHLLIDIVAIEPKQFQECFLSWVNSITQKLELEVIAIEWF